jgi:cell division septum initiation protein DivIVA
VDYLEAAESRIRQLQTHNANLEKQVRRLNEQLQEAQDEAGFNPAHPSRHSR